MQDKRKAPPNTYWRGDTLYSRFTVNGRSYRESLHTSDAKIAKRRVAALIERARGAAHFGEDAPTWEGAVLAWSEHIAAEVGARTAARYATSLEQVRPYLTGKMVSAIGRRDVDEFITARRRSGISNATIKRDLTAVSSVLAFCCNRDWREGNPARDRAGSFRERRDPIALPTEASLRFVLSRCEPELQALIRAARATGARLDELRNLRRKDYSAHNRTLHIRKAKGNKQRVIDLTDEAIAAIQSMAISMTTDRLFHRNGKPLADISSTFRSKVKWAQKAAQRERSNFEPFRFHDLRHLYAVESLKSRRISIYDLQQQLGHTSIKTTEIYLAFLTPDETRAAKRA